MTTDSSTTLEVITGSLSIGARLFLNLRRAGNGGVGCRTYRSAQCALQLAAGSTLTDNGTLTFDNGDTVALQGGVGGCCSAAPSPIVIRRDAQGHQHHF